MTPRPPIDELSFAHFAASSIIALEQRNAELLAALEGLLAIQTGDDPQIAIAAARLAVKNAKGEPEEPEIR